jgi:hypothetical protein
MGPRITLSGAQPEEATNGLLAHSKEFLDHPKELRLIVAVVSSSKTVENHDKNDTYPTVRIRHWEIVPDADKKAVADVLGRALADRTGMMELPLEPGAEAPSADEFPDDESFNSPSEIEE